ncbi:MAG: hypothetical protein R3B45_16080 [Bdellovibrionota bacterium]
MKNLLVKQIFVLPILLTFYMQSCVHGKRLKGEHPIGQTKKSSKAEIKDRSKGSKGAKTTTDDKNTDLSGPQQNVEQTEEKKLNVDLSQINIPSLLLRLGGPTPAYTLQDKLIIDNIVSKSELGPYEEAVVVLAVIHESTSKNSEKEDFEESDLYPHNTIWKDVIAKIKRPSIEMTAQARKVDLIAALSHNPLLQTDKIYSLIVRALETTYNSKPFRQKIKETMQLQVNNWATIGKNLGLTSDPLAKITSIDKTKSQENDSIQPALRFGASSFRNDESILEEAQNFVDQKLYRRAVELLERLKEDSPQYAAAQEKIREASNRAVQDLRRLAAKAFQNAIPVSDPAAKAQYLQTAKKHLEDALQQFPNADQLATVRENLSVINRDLLRISNASRTQ